MPSNLSDRFKQFAKENTVNIERALIALIFLLALLIRLWGIKFGLPYSYHYDETTYTGAALNLGTGKLGVQINPTGYTNILFLEYASFFIIGKITGLFSTVSSFGQLYRTDPSMFLLLGRLTSAILGAMNLLVVYQVGKFLRNQVVGILASLLLAVAFLHVRDSHFAVPDITATFFVSLTCLFCLLSLRDDRLRYVILAALMSGFAIATKWTVWPIAITLILAILLKIQKNEKSLLSSRSTWKLIFISGACFLVGYLLGGVQTIIWPKLYIDYALTELSAGETGGFFIWQVDTLPGWLFYLKTMSYGLGITVTLLFVIGLFAKVYEVIKKKDYAGIVFLSFPIIYFVIMGATRHYFARYVLLLVPFAVYIAAEFIYTLKEYLERKNLKFVWALVAGLVALGLLQQFVYDIRLDYLLTKIDTRTTAHEWIEENIPEGSIIAMDWLIHGPPLSTPEKLVPNSEKIYDVTTFDDDSGLSKNAIQWYQESNFNYLIASSFIYQIPLVDKTENDERVEFYKSLNTEFALIKEFKPYQGNSEPSFIFDEIYGPAISLWQRERPGPTIKIFKVN